MHLRITFASRLVLPMVLASLFLSACQTPDPRPLQLSVDQSKMSEGQPRPQGPGIDISTSETVKLDPVKIQPETSVGYNQLPTSITQLNQGPSTPLSLGGVVDLTLNNERGLKIQGYALRIAQYEVPLNKGIYDLMLSGNIGFSRTEQQNGENSLGKRGNVNARSRYGGFGLSQLLPSGAVIDFGYNIARQTASFASLAAGGGSGLTGSGGLGSSLDYPQTASLSITQPLLRGFGAAITNAPIRIAQLGEKGAAADYETNLQQTLNETLALYWQLIGAIEIHKVRIVSYSAALDLLRINTAKYNAGVLPQTDVLQAQAASESRRDDLIQARRNVRDIEDDLKQRIFLQSGHPNWPMEIEPTQPISWREIEVNLDQTVAAALNDRSEIRRAQTDIDRTRVNRDVAHNGMLPQLNITGQVDDNANEGSLQHSFGTMSDSRYNSYGIGLDITYPLQNRAARYRYAQTETAIRQADESMLQLQDTVTLQVRQAVRALRTARERIDVTQSGVVSETEKLRAEQKRYEVGISTAFEVLTFQNDLATAQSQHISAVVDYNIAAIQLERARGTLLQTYGVEVRGADLNPRIKPVGFPIGWN